MFIFDLISQAKNISSKKCSCETNKEILEENENSWLWSKIIFKQVFQQKIKKSCWPSFIDFSLQYLNLHILHMEILKVTLFGSKLEKKLFESKNLTFFVVFQKVVPYLELPSIINWKIISIHQNHDWNLIPEVGNNLENGLE